MAAGDSNELVANLRLVLLTHLQLFTTITPKGMDSESIKTCGSAFSHYSQTKGMERGPDCCTAYCMISKSNDLALRKRTLIPQVLAFHSPDSNYHHSQRFGGKHLGGKDLSIQIQT